MMNALYTSKYTKSSFFQIKRGYGSDAPKKKYVIDNRIPLYTREQVAEHNNDDSLWVIIDNRVYDVTLWALSHPGGKEILLRVNPFSSNKFISILLSFFIPIFISHSPLFFFFIACWKRCDPNVRTL